MDTKMNAQMPKSQASDDFSRVNVTFTSCAYTLLHWFPDSSRSNMEICIFPSAYNSNSLLYLNPYFLI